MDLSIIIPTYNRLWSLPKAIESCFISNLKIEVIVIDDGSTDGTYDWLCLQKNLVIIKQVNLGKDWAVNHGFEIAKGKYIRFLDSDDWFLPYSSDQLMAKANEADFDVIAAGHQVYNEEEELIKTINWQPCDDFVAQQLGECDSSHYAAYLFKKNFINDIPHRQEYGAKDDRKFIIEVALKNPKIAYINTSTLAHRTHSKERLQNVNGLSNSFNNLALLKIFKTSLATLTEQNQLTQRRKNAACNILWPLAHDIGIHHINEATAVAKWIFELNPNFNIPQKGLLGFLYKILGFKRTEKILKFRRFLIKGIQ